MTENEMLPDATYSDEEFNSDNEEDDGGYDDFVDDDEVAGTTTRYQTSPMEEEKYDKEEDEEDTEQYDGEFDEDESPAEGTTKEQLSAVVAEWQAPALALDVTEINAIINQNQNAYSNDRDHGVSIALSNVASLPNDISEESGIKRRASKWMDTIPQELCPERTDRFRKESILSNLDEVQVPNPVDEEVESDQIDVSSDSNVVPGNINPRIRAQSYCDLHCEKTAVPVRRARSLLYLGSLPSVEEFIIAGKGHDSEDSYSYDEDEEQYDNDNQPPLQRENDKDIAQLRKSDRPKTGPSSTVYTFKPIDENAPRAIHTVNRMEDFATGELDSNIALIPSSTDENKETTSQYDAEDDGYTYELEEEFPNEISTPYSEGENTSHKSTGETSDFNEFIMDVQHEADTLLQEACTLLEQQHLESESAPSDMSMIGEITDHEGTWSR